MNLKCTIDISVNYDTNIIYDLNPESETYFCPIVRAAAVGSNTVKVIGTCVRETKLERYFVIEAAITSNLRIRFRLSAA